MIIEKILKQLTPEKIKKEIKEIQDIKLPRGLQGWINEYEKVGDRNEFTWKFIFRLNMTINPFDLANVPSILEVKTLIIILIVLIDDIAEKSKEEGLINNLLRNIFGPIDSRGKKYFTISFRMWEIIEKNIKALPLYGKMQEIFRYDFTQVLNAIKYSYLANKYPFLINMSEHWFYAPYTLQGLVNCDIDLMSMPKFHSDELGKIREIFLSTQRLARIVNCLSTWEREIYEGDFANSMFAYAKESKIISTDDLNKKKSARKYIIKKIKKSRIKNDLLKEWENCYNRINNLCRTVKSINRIIFLAQLKELSSLYIICGSLTKK